MTNNEHNNKVLAEIMQHQEAIEELKASMLPADPVAEVSLEQCNAGAREAHFAKFDEQERIKAAVTLVVNNVVTPKADKPAKKATKDE